MASIRFTVLKTAVGVASFSLAIAAIVLVYLVYPGRPHSTASMHFEGFIELPRTKALNVLDYMTLSDNAVYVANESTGTVYKVQSNSPVVQDSTVASFPGDGAAHGIVIDPISHVGFVSRSETNTVDAFDPVHLNIIKHIPVAEGADGVFYDPRTKLICVSHGDPKLVTLIDPARQETVGTIALDGKPEYAAYDPVSLRIYQNIQSTNQTSVLDTLQRKVIQQWELPGCAGPTPMAIDAPGRRLFIGCSQDAKLIVLSLPDHRIIASVTVGADPDSIAFDQQVHRLYVTGKTGVLSVIEQNTPDSYSLIDSIRMHYGAHTLVIDPSSHRVYVAYASLLVSPRLAVFRPIVAGHRFVGQALDANR